MFVMAKTTSINLRVSPEFRHEIEVLAAYHGLSMSSYAHSLLVKSVRQAKHEHEDAFVTPPREQTVNTFSRHRQTVADRLGHSSVVMTLDTYSHVLPHIQTSATAALDRAMRGRQ